MLEAGWGDLKTLANGLFPNGGDEKSLTPLGRDEVREAVEVILRLSDRRNSKLILALEMLDKADREIEHLRARVAELERSA